MCVFYALLMSRIEISSCVINVSRISDFTSYQLQKILRICFGPLVNPVMNEWMKSYIAHVSSRRLFRALNIESNLAGPVIS